MHTARDTARTIEIRRNDSRVEAVGDVAEIDTVAGDTARERVGRDFSVVAAAVDHTVVEGTGNAAHQVPAIHFANIGTVPNMAVLVIIVKFTHDAAHRVANNVDGCVVVRGGVTVDNIVVLLSRHARDTAHMRALQTEIGVLTQAVLHHSVVAEVVKILAARVTGYTTDVVSAKAAGGSSPHIAAQYRVIVNGASVVVTDDATEILDVARYLQAFCRTGINGTESVVSADTADFLAAVQGNFVALGYTTIDSAVLVGTAYQTHRVACDIKVTVIHFAVLNVTAEVIAAHHPSVITVSFYIGTLEFEILHRAGRDIAKEALVTSRGETQSRDSVTIAVEMALEHLLRIGVVVADRSPIDRGEVDVGGQLEVQVAPAVGDFHEIRQIRRIFMRKGKLIGGIGDIVVAQTAVNNIAEVLEFIPILDNQRIFFGNIHHQPHLAVELVMDHRT